MKCSLRAVSVVAVLAGMTDAVTAQTPALVEVLFREASIQAAIAAARRDEARTVDDQIRICEVPAPPFGEETRGALVRREFEAAGLTNVRVDRVGNVLGERLGTTPGAPRVVIASHLDTVFPEGTDVAVRREGSLLRGPGIADNCRGLAVMIRMIRALDAGGVRTPGTLTFVASVGEEGLGDLRGVKALFAETLKGQVDRFVSIDGAGLYVTHVAVGSRRYRVTYNGPGGHSFAAFGLANPAHALGRAIARIADLQVPRHPLTTFNVGRVGGGASINAIPSEAWMEVDMRSSDAAALDRLVKQFEAAVVQAAADENARWGKPGVITVKTELVGDRPAGSLPAAAPIVQTARAAGSALGLSVPLAEGSTDANLPLSLGIPAVTIGGGGRGTGAHALHEAFDATSAWEGTAHALLLAVALTQP